MKIIKIALIGISFLVLGFAIVVAISDTTSGLKKTGTAPEYTAIRNGEHKTSLSVPWGTLGRELVSSGVIDANAFRSVFASRREAADLIDGDAEFITMDEKNADVVLAALWAFGLGNTNAILTSGPMMDGQYSDTTPPAGGFASTGGWTLADGDAMNHYAMHPFVQLSAEQQERVERVSKNVYRPCCNNPTHFPDCNHGMAMLGLLEILAKNGADESALYRAALAANRLWFPDTYDVIDAYAATTPTVESPADLVGRAYASGEGFARVRAAGAPKTGNSRGSSCGI